MTAQISDSFSYLDRPFDLVGINGTGLFDPADHGLEPRAPHTACWRGFTCAYAVRDDALHLAELQINLGPEQNEAAGSGALTILDRRPFASEGWGLLFKDLGPVPFTGGLLLGDKFVSSLYVHMGFAPAWKYQEVHELLFEGGGLTKAADRSAEMAEFREAMKDRPLSPGGGDDEQVKAWIDQTFSREYRW